LAFGHDREQYKAIYGTVSAITDAEKELGVKTNSRSTNWYVKIGEMTVAGCQVFYAIQIDKVSFCPPIIELSHKPVAATGRSGYKNIRCRFAVQRRLE